MTAEAFLIYGGIAMGFLVLVVALACGFCAAVESLIGDEGL